MANPLSHDHSCLRTSLLGTLLDAARHNLAHGAERVALFESGRAHLQQASAPVGGALGGEFLGERAAPAFEPQRIGAVAVGPVVPGSWRSPAQDADFYALKGALEALCRHFGVHPEFVEGAEPFLHPGSTAEIRLDGRAAGWLGELHPLVARSWDLPPSGAAAFELDLADLVAESTIGHERYEDVITHPAVYEDIAVTVPEEIEASAVRGAVREGGGELLRSARVFDLYRGEQVGEGRKSLALRLEFRTLDRTLTDGEVAERRAAIEASLERLGGSLRE